MSGIEFTIKQDNRKKVVAQVEELIKRSLEECGMVAEGYAKTNITRQKAVDTGALRNSISYKVVKEGSKDVCYVGSNLEYAPYIEFGTGIHYVGGRRTSWVFKDRDGNWHMTNGMKARPYLKPAVADHASEFEKIFAKNLTE